MTICPYCNTNLETGALKVQPCNDQFQLQNVNMISCPHCEKLLGFVYVVGITIVAAGGGCGGGDAGAGGGGGGSASISLVGPPGVVTQKVGEENKGTTDEVKRL